MLTKCCETSYCLMALTVLMAELGCWVLSRYLA